MYGGCVLQAPRAKGSFYHYHHHHHRRLSGDRAAEGGSCCCHCCHQGTAQLSCVDAGFSVRSVFSSSNLLYVHWLRQSTLIRWAPSRIFVSGGAGVAAARYGRLAAGWDRDPCPKRDWVRRSKCGARRVSSRVWASNGSFQDMLGLLDDVEECFGEDESAATNGTAEDTYVKEKIRHESYGGKQRRFYGNERDSSRVDDREGLRCESSSWISGDSASSKASRRRARYGSSSYGRNGEIAEKEVREVRKHQDESLSRRGCHASSSVTETKEKEPRIRGREDNTALSMGSIHGSREQYVQKDQYITRQKEAKEELEKVSKTSHVRECSATERDFGDKKLFNVVKEEVSAVDLLKVVKRQQNEIEQLGKDYLDLLRTTQVQNVNVTNASASSSLFNTRVENLGETSALPMSLLEEVQRQSSEIQQLNENYQTLMTAYKMQESNMIRESNSMKTFGTTLESREESSTSAVNFVQKGPMQYYNIDQKIVDDSRTTSQKLAETNHLKRNHQKLGMTDVHGSYIDRNSDYNKGTITISDGREKNAISAIHVVEKSQENENHTDITQDQQDIRCTDLRTSSQKVAERAHIHSDTETASISQWHFTKMGDQRESTSSAVNLIEERAEQVSNINEQVSGHIDSRRSSGKHTDIMEIHKNDMSKASQSQNHVETIVDHEENLTSVQQLVQLSREKRIQIDQQVIEEINVSKDIQSRINISEVFRHDAVNSAAALDDHEMISASASNMVDEVHHPRNQDGKRATQKFGSKNDSQRRPLGFFEGGEVNFSDSQMPSTVAINSGGDCSSMVKVQEAQEKQRSNLVHETFGASSGTLGSGYSSRHSQIHESDYPEKNDEFHLVKDDVIESARRLDKFSSHFVGEFADQLQQKISASEETDTTSYNSPETQMVPGQSSPLQKPKATGEREDETCKQEGPWQYMEKSEVTGPSDEIWDVRGASSQEPSTAEEPEKDSSIVRVQGTTTAPASTSGTIIKRSSKSLWSYIADIVRMGWRPQTSSQKSTLKSGTRSSSNDSVNSDAWYSGHEPEDDQEENVKTGRIAVGSGHSKAAVNKTHPGASSASGQVASEVAKPGEKVASEIMRPGEKVVQAELDVSIPMESIGGSYSCPPAPGLENLVPGDGGKGIEGIPAAATASQSAVLGSTSMSTSEEGTETNRFCTSEVGFVKYEGEQKAESITIVGGIGGKDVELKRRKLQRNKQVLREEFEEWEEAYKLESEQRKIDEIFMREALLEAKKAANMWEVPVGAVLVQDGKIIARGCNLVEDLRDSTAHAEMICIREASNLLRTWRLAGTTLYVTLEPCPMCAGAILQARIDTVVWGAPNKLLGADGSWVRLFPGGDEGKESLDQSNQMVGPVHPFHPKITVRRGVLAMECADAMQQFFQLRRKKKKPEPPPPSCLPVNYPSKLVTKMHNIFCMMTCM